jgi:hypothetical protein
MERPASNAGRFVLGAIAGAPCSAVIIHPRFRGDRLQRIIQ